MARPLRLPLLLAFVLASLAGCVQDGGADGREAGTGDGAPLETNGPPPPTPAADEAVESPAAESAGTPRDIEVYSSRGVVIGADPAHPLQDGPLVEGTPAGREDRFVAPAGTIGLAVSLRYGTSYGAWSGGIEVRDAGGAVVFRVEEALGEEDPTGGGCVLCDGFFDDSSGPGPYTVSYHIAGAVDLELTITAKVTQP